NCMERAVVMAEADRIRLADLPLALQPGEAEEEPALRERGAPAISLESGRTMREVERDYILSTLKQMGGNRTRTAKVLGISVRGLRDKLKEYAATAGEDQYPPSK
ncbi:MAG: helix-turn-helix domain-containing protein, partial [candidate division NC10 bacterium]|nr:helix-turn-helix domain-containing protein [candidate division NC10 bacterium]